jgi:hypothetical protein
LSAQSKPTVQGLLPASTQDHQKAALLQYLNKLKIKKQNEQTVQQQRLEKEEEEECQEQEGQDQYPEKGAVKGKVGRKGWQMRLDDLNLDTPISDKTLNDYFNYLLRFETFARL